MRIRECGWLLAFGLFLVILPPAARAQTTGAIFGVVTDSSTGLPVAGAEVVASGPALQGVQRATADERGRYRIPLLPPGPYRIAGTRAGYLPSERADLVLRLARTLRANLVLAPAEVQLPEQAVRAPAPVVDVGSAESATAVTREAYEALPLARGTFDVASIMAPSAVDYPIIGIGFAGAQAPENRVTIEGLDVSDTGDGMLYVSLPAKFVEQVDVKSGNYLPEFGRASGGVLSAVTRSGSNELHGSVFADLLTRRNGERVGNLGEAIWRSEMGSPRSFSGGAGGELGGPIQKDRLWFHVGFRPAVERIVTERWLRANVLDANGDVVLDADRNPVMFDVPGTGRRVKQTTRTYAYTAKLTWRPSEDHSLTLTSFGSPESFDGELPGGPGGGGATAPYRRFVGYEGDVVDVAGRWSGRFLARRLILEAAAGIHTDHYLETHPREVDGVDLYGTPVIMWQRGRSSTDPYRDLSTFEAVPLECQVSGTCQVRNYQTGGNFFRRFDIQRLQARLAATWLASAWGAHQLKGGADLESTRADRWTHGLSFVYVGAGAAAGFRTYTSGQFLSPSPSGPGDVAFDDTTRAHGRGTSPALFLQDSWQPFPSLTVNAGLRWEGQTQENALRSDASTRIRILDEWAPRAQVVWDPSGQGRSKVAGSWGRFYEAIPLTPSQWSFGTRDVVGVRYAASSCPGFNGPGPAPYDPRACTQLVPNGVQDVFGSPTTASLFPGATPVAPNLKGQYVDQFGVALEYGPWADISIGLEYQGRRLRRAVEDISSNDGLTYFIANPGEGAPFTHAYPGFPSPVINDPRGSTTYDFTTGRYVNVAFPRPQRDYDGLTVRATKAWSRAWLLQASWTLSRLRGNYSGLFQPDVNQLFPNITVDYDLPTLMANRTGLLPFDRTHVVKLFAARRVELPWRLALTLGAAYVGTSGAPVSVLGAHELYGTGEAYLVQRGMAGRTPFLHQLDLRGQIEVAMAGPYALRLKVDLYNALDARGATRVDQNYTFNYVQPISGLRCSKVDAPSNANPAAAVLAACPDLAFLKTLDGRPVTVNANYGQAREFQAPLSARVSVEVTF
jgi:outer membrane receptor protein involved in Fe transport